MPTLQSIRFDIAARARLSHCRWALLAPFFALAVAGSASASEPDDDNRSDETYAVGLWGDLPYSADQATGGVPNLIADMNAQRLTFTVHDGDLKAGSSSPCNNEVYTQSLAFFNALRAGDVIPGDNDWTDCDRPANGGFNSRDRLDRERAVFFSTPYSLGQRRMRQDVCNNLCDTTPDRAEYTDRDLANLRWLQQSFAYAREQGSVAIILLSQANPGWDLSDVTRAPPRNPQTLAQTDGQPDGYAEFLTALRSEVIAIRRPVAYVYGDSHYHRVDKPFLDTTGRRLENFTRVETFGNNAANGTNDVQWIKPTVDPCSRRVLVPGDDCSAKPGCRSRALSLQLRFGRAGSGTKAPITNGGRPTPNNASDRRNAGTGDRTRSAVSRDGLFSQLFHHRHWRANLWASGLVNSPRSAKNAFGHS
jgi:hypothetical protein